MQLPSYRQLMTKMRTKIAHGLHVLCDFARSRFLRKRYESKLRKSYYPARLLHFEGPTTGRTTKQ